MEGVTKTFAARGTATVALDGVDVSIDAGQFVAVLGPSGCGKSTLLAIIAGLEPASAGVVTVDGRPVRRPATDAGVMFQRDLLFDWRTCEDNVLLQFRMRGEPVGPHRQRARDLLRMVGMEQFARRYPRELSGGMRQRVALCRSLVHDPPLLLMDEPFGALDAITRERLNADLRRLTDGTGATVLFVTHSIDEATFLGDRVLVMSPRPGRLVGDVRIDLPGPREGPRIRELPEFVGHTARLRRLLGEHGEREHGDARVTT